MVSILRASILTIARIPPRAVRGAPAGLGAHEGRLFDAVLQFLIKP